MTEIRTQDVSRWLSIWITFRFIRMHVGAHGSCVHSHCSWQLTSKRLNKLIVIRHIGVHSSCVRSNNHVYMLSFPLSGRTNRASLPFPYRPYWCIKWLRLYRNMAGIARLNGWDWNARWKEWECTCAEIKTGVQSKGHKKKSQSQWRLRPDDYKFLTEISQVYWYEVPNPTWCWLIYWHEWCWSWPACQASSAPRDTTWLLHPCQLLHVICELHYAWS